FSSRRRHTRSKRDWSSDVCSSDLDGFFGPGAGTFLILANTGLCRFGLLTASGNMKVASVASCGAAMVSYAVAGHVMWLVALPAEIGRAACRGRVEGAEGGGGGGET